MTQPTKLDDFNKHAINALMMYCTLLEAEPHVMKLPQLDCLLDWLVHEDRKTLIAEVQSSEEMWWPDVHGPDICATCYHWFGMTLGGRIREGCIHCKDEGSHPTFFMYSIRDKLYVNDQHCEYLMSWAIYKWSIAKPRQRQMTAKHMRDNGLYVTNQVNPNEAEVEYASSNS